MQGILQSTMSTKRLILEGSEKTKQTSIFLLIAGFGLLILLTLSYLGTGTSWTCELDNSDPKHAYICKQLRKDASCMSLTGPINTEIILDINSEVKASALIICPWENGISELRVCFILGALLTVILGISSLAKEDKKLSEVHINAAYFFSLLLAIAACFDLYAIEDSVVNNFSLCTLTEEFTVENGVSGERMECSHDIYRFTVYTGFVCSLLLIIAALQVKNWRSNLSMTAG